jgi:hypothetical protein
MGKTRIAPRPSRRFATPIRKTEGRQAVRLSRALRRAPGCSGVIRFL